VVEINWFLEQLYKLERFEVDHVFRQYMGYADRLKSHIVDATMLVNKMIDGGKTVLFEGAQGTHLDVDFGTYLRHLFQFNGRRGLNGNGCGTDEDRRGARGRQGLHHACR
jgi:hypothetical protein